MKKFLAVGAIFVTLVIIGATVLYLTQGKATVVGPSLQTSSGAVVKRINFNNNGFEPAAILAQSGDIIEISNSSSVDLQLNSDPHPIHTYNSELNLGNVTKGESKRFVVSKKGNFYYHNHLNSSQTGRIVVQ